MRAYSLSSRPRPEYELEGKPAVCGLPLGHHMGNHVTEETLAEQRKRRRERRERQERQ